MNFEFGLPDSTLSHVRHSRTLYTLWSEDLRFAAPSALDESSTAGLPFFEFDAIELPLSNSTLLNSFRSSSTSKNFDTLSQSDSVRPYHLFWSNDLRYRILGIRQTEYLGTAPLSPKLQNATLSLSFPALCVTMIACSE